MGSGLRQSSARAVSDNSNVAGVPVKLILAFEPSGIGLGLVMMVATTLLST
jgi:hypothetical protein